MNPDVDLYYEISGSGEPLLLLHGFTGCGRDWQYAGRDLFERNFRLIIPDARGHGRSSNPQHSISHRQCAKDVFALLDRLGIQRISAIGISMGGNILLHLASEQPQRFKSMVLVSATMFFPDQARELMRQTDPDRQSTAAWESMRQRHESGDEQIRELWIQQRAFADSYDDMNLTPEDLGRIEARTLIVYGDRDPLYPVEMGVNMYRAMPQGSLWVIPNAGHAPVFLDAAPLFARIAMEFLQIA